MQSFYIDTDLKTSRIFVAPFPQIKKSAYVILADNRSQADTLLRKLTAGLLKSPLAQSEIYQIFEIITDAKLGIITIYQLVGSN